MKISSEAAGTIALSRVVVQEMTLASLVDTVATVTGKDRDRITEVLKRGTIVSGGSRLRWEPFEAGDLPAVIARLPDPDPTLAFDPNKCTQFVLRRGVDSVALSKEAGSKRRLLRRVSFWDNAVTLGRGATYVTYSYADRADVYRLELNNEERTLIARAADLLAYRAVRDRIRALPIERIDYYCARQRQ